MNYPDSVQFLYALGNEIHTAKFGLDRIRTLLDAMGRPQDRLRFIHVAGTNGKGSVCAMIESGLRAAGERTGLFTSPHLAEPTERIRIGGAPVDAARFAGAFNQVHRIAEQLLEAGRMDLHPTYFETVTAMALQVFDEERVDRVVFEVGLGGRLDATNVVTPELCVITPIDFDHEAYLGRSIEAIAGEKAGILKPGIPAVFSAQRPEAAAVLDARAAELGIAVTRVGEWQARDLIIDPRGSRFVLPEAGGLAVHCPLAGEHQVGNAITAAAALLRADVSREAIGRGIAAARWPGRLERVRETPEIILDGAHNPAGARSLAAYLDRFYSARRVHLIYGGMRDKAIAEITAILFPRAQHVIVTAPRQARAFAPEAMREISDHPNLQVTPNLEAALQAVRDVPPEHAILITGSLFLVAEARTLLVKEP